MTYLKAGTWLALAFASGGGAGVYWSASSDSKQDESPSDEATEVADAKSDSADERELTPQEIQPASTSEPPLHGPTSDQGSSDEESAAAELSGRSAADILWALEQAYQNHEQRILLLEAKLHEQTQVRQAESDEEEGPSPAVLEVNGPEPGESLGVESGGAPEEAVAFQRVPVQRVASLNEPVEDSVEEVALLEKHAALSAQQQVVFLNHYQPIFVNDQTPTRATSPRSGFVGSAAMSGLGQRRSQAHQDSNQATTTSWVASGFDVYSR